MNILIADSGSTKTEWILICDSKQKIYYQTEGLNPYFRTEEQLIKAIREGLKNQMGDTPVDVIHFYGSGCGRPSTKKIMNKAISASFSDSEIHVESDMLAAAKACFGNSSGIACILGTGSNSCIYNGKTIKDRIPSLGFILGDEGGGGYFGKQILQSYFYNSMPADLRKALEDRYNMKLEYILQKVYKESQSNRFVASFAQLLGEYPLHPFIKKIVREGFEDFADKQLSFFGKIKGKEVGFVGSIAAVHAETLREVLKERGLKLGIIVRNPIERLTDYHLKSYESKK